MLVAGGRGLVALLVTMGRALFAVLLAGGEGWSL